MCALRFRVGLLRAVLLAAAADARAEHWRAVPTRSAHAVSSATVDLRHPPSRVQAQRPRVAPPHRCRPAPTLSSLSFCCRLMRASSSSPLAALSFTSRSATACFSDDTSASRSLRTGAAIGLWGGGIVKNPAAAACLSEGTPFDLGKPCQNSKTPPKPPEATRAPPVLRHCARTPASGRGEEPRPAPPRPAPLGALTLAGRAAP